MIQLSTFLQNWIGYRCLNSGDVIKIVLDMSFISDPSIRKDATLDGMYHIVKGHKNARWVLSRDGLVVIELAAEGAEGAEVAETILISPHVVRVEGKIDVLCIYYKCAHVESMVSYPIDHTGLFYERRSSEETDYADTFADSFRPGSYDWSRCMNAAGEPCYMDTMTWDEGWDFHSRKVEKRPARWEEAWQRVLAYASEAT